MASISLRCLLCKPEDGEKEDSEVLSLRCGHKFCWMCINKYASENINCQIKCPVNSCKRYLRDKVIRKILSVNDVSKYDQRCLQHALRNNSTKMHKCLLDDCYRMVEYSDADVQYTCALCGIYNCVQCNAPHRTMSCAQFKSLNVSNSMTLCQTEKAKAKKVLDTKLAEERRAAVINENKNDLIKNSEPFVCVICSLVFAKGKGVQLRDCFHVFCRTCLSNHVAQDNNIPPLCPFQDCRFPISSRECNKLLHGQQLSIYNNKLMTSIKPKLTNVHQCQEPNCSYFCEVDGFLSAWHCPKCKKFNCVICKTIHNGGVCPKNIDNKQKEKKEADKKEAERREIERKEAERIEELIKKKELMRCPDCHRIINKTGGCNFVKCTCGQELCWILQMHRWGPKGRNDTSGGCRCGVNGKKCHKDCIKGCIPG